MENKNLIIFIVIAILLIIVIVGVRRQRQGGGFVEGNLLQEMENSKNIMWVAPHPDDEISSSGFLSLSSLGYNKNVYVVPLYAKGTTTSPGTAEDRIQDNQDYKNFLELKDYVYGFPGLAADSYLVKEDVMTLLADFTSQNNIDMIITLENTHGATGEPKHILASGWITEFAKENNIKLYYFINRVPGINRREVEGTLDPLPVTDILNLDENFVVKNGVSVSLWKMKVDVLKIYSSSQPGSYYFTQNPDEFEKTLHLEHYRKVN